MYEIIFWGALFIIFVIAESVTAQLVSIWFAAGSLLSLIVSIFTDNLLIQLVAFIIVSVVLLLFTRPLLRRVMKDKHVATNADSFIGKEGVLTEAADDLQNTGRMIIDGLSWKARGEGGIQIDSGVHVIIVRIEGVTAYVKPLQA